MDFIHKPVSPGPLQSCRCHTRERCFTSSVGARDGDIITCTDTERASGVDTCVVHVAPQGKLVSVLGSSGSDLKVLSLASVLASGRLCRRTQ